MLFLKILLFLTTFQMIGQTDFDKAEKSYKLEKWAEAKTLFSSYLKANANDPRTIEYLGDIAGHQKKWDEAIKHYKILKVAYPKEANYWYKFGGALGMKAKSVNKFRALGMIDDIETSFLNASKLDPKSINARWALVMLYIELPGIIGGSETKSQIYANQLMALSKVDGYLAIGYIDEYFKRFYKAETHYLKAHEIGNSKTTYQKLYDLYTKKIKNLVKAKNLKEQFEK